MWAPQAFQGELLRLEFGVRGSEPIPGIGTVRFIVKCKGDAPDVLRTAKTVMAAVSRACTAGWNEIENWESLLPEQFVRACAPAMTRSEADAWLARWQKLSPGERKREERFRTWSLANWLYWLSPTERTWLWWDALVLDGNQILVLVAVEEWPFPWGALSWLFRGSGAMEVSPDPVVPGE
jgi:hypothetical protein